MQIVDWKMRKDGAETRGTCAVVSIDCDAVEARTVCRCVVMFPGPARRGSPDCADCKRILANRKKRVARVAEKGK